MPSTGKTKLDANRVSVIGKMHGDRLGHATRDTALYTYLRNTLKSPRLRDLLEEGANEHVGPEESGFGRRA